MVLRAIQRRDRARLRALGRRHPGLEIHPEASTNLACARLRIAPGGRLRIGAGVVTERIPDALRVLVEPGAEIEIGAGTWLRTELETVRLVAFAGARLVIGPEGFLNGCHLSAKSSLELGRRVWVGPGSRVFDADQHDIDEAQPERIEPVTIGDHVWIASDVTVLRGVRIGAHSVIGARSVVTRDVPPCMLAFGSPARPRRKVGDRSRGR